MEGVYGWRDEMKEERWSGWRGEKEIPEMEEIRKRTDLIRTLGGVHSEVELVQMTKTDRSIDPRLSRSTHRSIGRLMDQLMNERSTDEMINRSLSG